MRAHRIYATAAVVTAALLIGCVTQKYVLLKGTSVDNPPVGRMKIALGAFPVASKAGVVDPIAAVSSPHESSGGISRPGASGGMAAETHEMEIARASRIEDLAGTVLRELRREEVRIFVDLEHIADLEETRRIANPFVLVSAESGEAQLEISGKALIRSRRISKRFTRKTDSVEVTVTVKDVATGEVLTKNTLRLGVNLVFNSEELEEAMAIGVVTHLLQRTLF